MKKLVLLLACSIIAFTSWSQDYKDMIAQGDYTISSIEDAAETYFDTEGRGRGTGYKSFRRWLYSAERNMDASGKLKSPEFFQNILESYNAELNINQNALARTVVGTWEEMGPTSWNATAGWNPGVGRITSIAIDEATPTTMIVGSETGGVWRSTDGGQNWTVLSDNLSNIRVYALAIDPKDPNIYYWGTTGGTIFRSTDSGSTWNFYSDIGSGFINKILIDPTANSTKMYCTAQGGGIYKSVDSGLNWTQIAPNNGYDIEFKPGDPSTVYASGTSFYQSNNGGNTFNVVTGTFANGPKMIGVSEDDPNVVYVVEADSGTFGGLYKSTNAGTSFNQLSHIGKNYFGYSSAADDDLGQAPRDMDIVVNPQDANEVHIAGINTWRSVNGGNTFNITSQWVPGNAQLNQIGYCHADVDILNFAGNPTDGYKLYVGSDGGVFVANNTSSVNSSYYTDLTTGLGIRQFYRIGISQTDPVVVTGGSQDNGTSTMDVNGDWTDWLGADGMEGFIDKDNTQVMYGSTQFGGLNKTTNGGATRFPITQPDNKGGSGAWNWVVPFEKDPIDSNVIYVAFDQVYKSLDGGTSWTAISQNFGANIDHFKISPVDNEIMYLSINGDFYKTINGGNIWTLSSGLDLGFNARVNDIAVHPSDPTKVAIVSSGFGVGKVYESSNTGGTWISLGAGLPNFSAQAITYQDNGNNALYVGMNYGIYYRDDTTTSWLPFSNGLPNVEISELEINTADDRIYASTYGRGLWRSALYDESLSLSEIDLEAFKIYPNPASSDIILSWDRSDLVSIRIYNALGKLMYYASQTDISEPTRIDVSNFASGLYFIKINNSNGSVTKKLVIE